MADLYCGFRASFPLGERPNYSSVTGICTGSTTVGAQADWRAAGGDRQLERLTAGQTMPGAVAGIELATMIGRSEVTMTRSSSISVCWGSDSGTTSVNSADVC